MDAAEALESAKMYSDRHSLPWLLQALNTTALFSYKRVAADRSSSSDAAKSFMVLFAEAVAAQGISEVATKQEERLFGDLTGSATEKGVPPGSPSSAADQSFGSLVARACAVLAQYYSSLTTGTGWVVTSGRNGGGRRRGSGGEAASSLQEDFSTCFALSRTWQTAAAQFWRSHTTENLHGGGGPQVGSGGDTAEVEDSASPSATAVVGEAFLSALLAPAPPSTTAVPTEEERQVVEAIALVFAKGHLPELRLHTWTLFLELAREANRLRLRSRLSASFKRLSVDAIATRCLITVLCDTAITPVMQELAKPSGGGAGGGPLQRKNALLPPQRVLNEVRAKASLLAQEGGWAGSDSLCVRLSIVFADSLFLYLFKPYPTLVASFFLAAKT